MRFKDKVILISGAKQGMGLAIAKRLKSEGATLVLNDKIMDENFKQVCSELEAFPAVCDLSQLGEIPEVIKAVISKFGKIDAVVAQHAYMNMGKFEDQSEKEW